MASPALVEVPGLNFDWLNLDTEQGVKVQAGRRGLTLEEINTLSYGNADKPDTTAPVTGRKGATTRKTCRSSVCGRPLRR